MKKLALAVLSLAALSTSAFANMKNNYTEPYEGLGSSPERCVINVLVDTLNWQNEPWDRFEIGFNLHAELLRSKETDNGKNSTYRISGSVTNHIDGKAIVAVGDFSVTEKNGSFVCSYFRPWEGELRKVGTVIIDLPGLADHATLEIHNEKGEVVSKNPIISQIR